MNALKPVWGVFCLFTFVQSYAAGPLWTFTPTTATTVTVSPTGAATVEYIVQNQSAKPTRLKMLPVNGITQLSDCILAPRGQPGDQCTLNLSINGAHIAPAGVHGGPNVCQTNRDGSPNLNQCYRPAANYVLNITKGSTPSPPPTQRTVVAVGASGPSGSTTFPAIYVSDDNGSTWAVASFPAAPGTGLLADAFCIPNSMHCVATGDYTTGGGSVREVLNYTSDDGGYTWASSTPIGILGNTIRSVSCNANNQCVSVGNDFASPNNPLSYRSTDGGVNWIASSPQGRGASTILTSVSCSLGGNQCVAVGTYDDGAQKPIVYTSQDNGATWSDVLPTPQGIIGENLYGVFCNGTGSRCIAVGNYRLPGAAVPIAYISTDNGTSWTPSAPFPNPTTIPQVQINAISCDADALHCVAVGNYVDSISYLLSYISNDGGNTWSLSANQPERQGDPTSTNSLLGISCDTTATSCTAAGFYQLFGQGFPMSYTSTDGGNSWAVSTAFPTSAPFNVLTGIG